MQRGSVRRFPKSGNFLTFAEEFLLHNDPCLIGEERTQGWKARAFWQKEGKPDLDYLAREFGSAMVPVADCSCERFSTHPKSEMRLTDYIDYWRTLMDEPKIERRAGPETEARSSRKEGKIEGSETSAENLGGKRKLLYLKDWHFKRDYPGYDAYSLLEFFQSDWLNELWDLRQDVCDDYRFVYMGPRGTWTPFHADVLR